MTVLPYYIWKSCA